MIWNFFWIPNTSEIDSLGNPTRRIPRHHLPPLEPMALSTPPPPPGPSSTIRTRPLYPDLRPANSQPLPFYSPPSRRPFNPNPNPNPNHPQLAPLPLHPQDPSQLLYPVVNSSRCFVLVPGPPSRPPFVFPHADPVQLQEWPGYSGPIHLLASGHVLPLMLVVDSSLVWLKEFLSHLFSAQRFCILCLYAFLNFYGKFRSPCSRPKLVEINCTVTAPYISSQHIILESTYCDVELWIF